MLVSRLIEVLQEAQDRMGDMEIERVASVTKHDEPIHGVLKRKAGPNKEDYLIIW